MYKKLAILYKKKTVEPLWLEALQNNVSAPNILLRNIVQKMQSLHKVNFPKNLL